MHLAGSSTLCTMTINNVRPEDAGRFLFFIIIITIIIFDIIIIVNIIITIIFDVIVIIIVMIKTDITISMNTMIAIKITKVQMCAGGPHQHPRDCSQKY